MARSVAEIGLRATLDAAPAYRTAAEMADKINAGVKGRGAGHGGAGGGLLGNLGLAGVAGAVSGGTEAVLSGAFHAIAAGAEEALSVLTRLAGGVLELAKGAAESGLEFDRQRVGLAHLTRTAEEANAVFDAMASVAARGGGKLDTLLATARGFVSAGQQAGEATKNVEAVSTVSKVFAADFDRVGYAMKEVLEMGVVQMGQLRQQIAQAGIPISFFYQELGITAEQFDKLETSGRLTGETLLWAFRHATEEGGRFGTSVAQVNASASGTFDGLIGKIGILRGKIGESIINNVLNWSDALAGGFDPEALAGSFDKWFTKAEGSGRQVFKIAQDIWNIFTGLLGIGERHLSTWGQVESALKRVRGAIPDLLGGMQKTVVGAAEFARWVNIAADRIQMMYDVSTLLGPKLSDIAKLFGKFGQSGIRPGHEWAREVDAELRDFLREQRGQDWGAFARKAMDATDRDVYLRRNEPPPPGASLPGPTVKDWRTTLKPEEIKPRGTWETLVAAVIADKAGRTLETGRGVLDAFKGVSGGAAANNTGAGVDARSREYADKLSAAMNRSMSTGQTSVIDQLKAAYRVALEQKAIEGNQLDQLRKIADKEPVVFQPPPGVVFKGAGGGSGGA